MFNKNDHLKMWHFTKWKSNVSKGNRNINFEAFPSLRNARKLSSISQNIDNWSKYNGDSWNTRKASQNTGVSTIWSSEDVNANNVAPEINASSSPYKALNKLKNKSLFAKFNSKRGSHVIQNQEESKRTNVNYKRLEAGDENKGLESARNKFSTLSKTFFKSTKSQIIDLRQVQNTNLK